MQAMWRILLPQFLAFVKNERPELHQEVLDNTHDPDSLATMLETDELIGMKSKFIAASANANYQYWWTYLEMVTILLQFTRAQRDGIWELHLHSFQAMLPFFMRYDHFNYARWGTIYLNDMHQLPVDVQTEFQNGNFVVKRANLKFNQVSPDQSQEWLNVKEVVELLASQRHLQH